MRNCLLYPLFELNVSLSTLKDTFTCGFDKAAELLIGGLLELILRTNYRLEFYSDQIGAKNAHALKHFMTNRWPLSLGKQFTILCTHEGRLGKPLPCAVGH